MRERVTPILGQLDFNSQKDHSDRQSGRSDARASRSGTRASHSDKRTNAIRQANA